MIGIRSKSQNLKCGVPQGSVLGARMYTMYARPVSAIIEHNNIFYHSYADDTQLYIQCDNNEESVRCAISHLEKCISEICEIDETELLKNQPRQD